MRRLLALLLTLFSLSLHADDGKQIVDRMTQKLRGHANVASYEITVYRPTWSRTIRIKAWDDRARKRFFIRILDPPKDAGISFLRIGYNLWNYLPKVEKVMKIPPSMMLQPWMGSDFTNDDLVKESSYVEDYDQRLVATELREGERVQKIELTPYPNAPVVWGKVVFWVRMDDLPVEEQFFDEKGLLVKELRFQEFKQMDGVLTPTFWEMKAITKEGQRTTIRTLAIDFDPSPPIPDSVFTAGHFTRGD